MLIIFIFIIGIFLRIYNFPNRLIFGPEQGMSLITSASNLQKFSLLGETNFIRATIDSHIPFHGAYYSYFLLPFQIIFKYQVLPITLVFLILNLVTGLVLYQVAKNIFGKTVASFSLFYYLSSAVMIHHSLFTWIVNPTPLLAILTLQFFFNILKNKKILISSLCLGILSGLGFGMQNLYLFFAFLVFILSIFYSKKKILSAILFFLGGILGTLPTVIFDIRHDFYHLRTFWQYFLDVLNHQASGSLAYYNFLYLSPLLFILLAFISSFLYKKSKYLTLFPVLIFLYFNFTSPLFNLNESTGMPKGLTYKSLYTFASLIDHDHPVGTFNVATLWDFDTRAYPLRYLLQYVYRKTPQGLEDYKDVTTLYVAAPINYDINHPQVWELTVYQPYKIKEIPTNIIGYKLYKLTKQNRPLP